MAGLPSGCPPAAPETAPSQGPVPLLCPPSISAFFPCFTLHPLPWFIYFTPLTSREQPGFISFTAVFLSPTLSTKRKVSLCGLAPRGRAQAPRGGGRTLRPPNDTSAKDLPSWAPSLVFLKGFFFCVIRSSWQLYTVQLNTQVLFLRQIC